MTRRKSTLLVLTLFFLTACASGRKTEQKPTGPAQPSAPQLPQPIATPEANVHIHVAYPVSGQMRPAVDSNFIFGSVGNGKASLLINGVSVPLYQNGAFLAFLPMPTDGVYHLYAQRLNDLDSATITLGVPAPSSTTYSGKGKSGYEAMPSPVWARVVKGSDTLQTGSDVAPGSPTPEADRRWFFPRGAEVRVVGKEGGYDKIELDKNTTAWVPDTNLQLGEKPTRVPDIGGITPAPGFIDIVMPADFNPFLITPDGNSLRITIYGSSGTPVFNTNVSDPLISNIGINPLGSSSTEFTVLLSKPVWGYKAFYQSGGALVVRLRRPPTIQSGEPLRGIRIMIDPGHPPAGAIGPTGLTEAEANLSIATRVRDLLQAKGATVLMTHTTLSGLVSSTNQSVELGARADLAVRENVDLMVSVHNNAFPDGVNPFVNYGTNTYYYHPFGADLARQLNNEIAPVVSIPNGGAHQKSLAICRPTWMPSALTESLFMMFPDQEQALRDPKFLDALAAAHVRGIEDFLRQRTP